MEEIKAPTAEDLQAFRNQLRKQVEGELDIDTKKSVLNSLIKKLKVDQNGLLEIDFGVTLGNTPYGIRLMPRNIFHSSRDYAQSSSSSLSYFRI